MFNSFQKYFLVFDIYATPIPLYYKGNSKYKTFFGSIISFISITTLVILCIIFMNNLFSKNSFTIVSSQLNNLSEVIDFSDIPFLFSLCNSSGHLLDFDNKLFSFAVVDNHYEKFVDENGKSSIKLNNTEIKFDRCDKISSYPTLSKYFSAYNLSKYMCILPKQNLTMYGRFGDLNNGFKGFRIYINRCNSEKSECYDLEYINKKLSNVKFTFMNLEYGINHYSNNNTNVYYEIRADTKSLSTSFMKKYYYSYTSGHYIIDTSIVFDSKKKDFFFYFSSQYMDIDISSYNSLTKEPSIAYFAFNCDAHTVQYQKKYLKLTSTLSSFGGALNIIVTFFRFINWYFTRKLLVIDMMNQISRKNYFSSDDPYKKDNSRSIIINPRLKPINIEKNVNPLNLKNNNHKNYSICSYLFICSNKAKKKIKAKIDYYNKVFRYYLSIEKIFICVKRLNSLYKGNEPDSIDCINLTTQDPNEHKSLESLNNKKEIFESLGGKPKELQRNCISANKGTCRNG